MAGFRARRGVEGKRGAVGLPALEAQAVLGSGWRVRRGNFAQAPPPHWAFHWMWTQGKSGPAFKKQAVQEKGKAPFVAEQTKKPPGRQHWCRILIHEISSRSEVGATGARASYPGWRPKGAGSEGIVNVWPWCEFDGNRAGRLFRAKERGPRCGRQKRIFARGSQPSPGRLGQSSLSTRKTRGRKRNPDHPNFQEKAPETLRLRGGPKVRGKGSPFLGFPLSL